VNRQTFATQAATRRDLLLSIKRLAVATCELKNPGTVKAGAGRSSNTRRIGTRVPCLLSRRGLWCTLRGPDEVHMTPGCKKRPRISCLLTAAGHPGQVQCGRETPASIGYRTGYFWEEVLQRIAFSIFSAILCSLKPGMKRSMTVGAVCGRITREKLVFPRYHQLGCRARM